MTVSTHAVSDYSHTESGALVISDERIESMAAEWRDTLNWLAEH